MHNLPDFNRRLRSRGGAVLSIVCLAGGLFGMSLVAFEPFWRAVRAWVDAHPAAGVAGVAALRLAYLALISLRRYWLHQARQAAEADPTNPERHIALSQAYERKDNLRAAVHAFRNAIQLDPALDIERRRPTADAMARRYGRSRRQARWLREMTRLATMDYLIEKADRSPVKTREAMELRRVRPRDNRQLRRQCRASIESVKMEISGLDLFRGSLRQFVSGYQYYEDRALLDEEIHSLQSHLDELEAILRDLEDA